MADVLKSRDGAIDSCVAGIVAAYISNNPLASGDLPALIECVHVSLTGLGAPQVQTEPKRKLTPAEIRKSITPNALVSFIDGKSYKVLKRHLGLHGLDAYGYRQRFGLPDDYPMVAPSYSARRSGLSLASSIRRHSHG